MKKIGLIILYITISIFLSCSNGNDDINLGSGYHFTNNYWSYIWPESGYIETPIYSRVTNYKVNDKYIIAKQIPDCEHYKISFRSNLESRYSIYCSFLKDSTTKDFLNDISRKIVRTDSNLYKKFKLMGVTNENSPKDWEKIDKYLDSIFHHDPYYIKLFAARENYWIIDKKINKRFGPLTINEFNNLRNKFGIQLNLDN